MKIVEWIKKSEKLVYFNRCRIHRNEAGFRRMVLEGYNNPDFIEITRNGEEYRGQTIYYIDEFGRSVGFFSEFLFALTRLCFADDRGFTPYINWGEECLYYEPEGVEGEKNAFLYYFSPVSEVTRIEYAAYVVKATGCHIKSVRSSLGSEGYDITEEYVDALADMIKKYIQYNQKTQKYLEESYEKLIGNKKALAVHFRGTDYRRQYNNHPVFVTIEQEIEKVREVMTTKDYEVIFLATDEQEAVDVFRREFGDIVKVFDDTWRADGGDESVAFSCAERKNHHYLLGLEVLRDQYMLTRCDGLVCGISNLTMAARMMRKAWYDNAYEDLVVIDNDLCHNDRRFCDATH